MLLTTDRVLFERLIDYAGLFPPASLSMELAAAEYREGRAGPNAWLLGRFICPASRLEELAATLVATMEAGEEAWPVSVILDGEPAAAVAAAQAFDREMNPGAAVALLEVRLPAETSDGRPCLEAVELIRPIVQAALAVSPHATPFFEIARQGDWVAGIENVTAAIDASRSESNRHMGAKLRCGGLEPEAFPTPDQVARFIVACNARKLPFKATAGLHHPMRHPDRELGVMRHGFLNLLFAAAFASVGLPESAIVEIIEETDPSVFEIGSAALRWRGHDVGVAAVRVLRRERFAAYGSCSFDEPIEDLMSLGLLGGGQ